MIAPLGTNCGWKRRKPRIKTSAKGLRDFMPRSYAAPWLDDDPNARPDSMTVEEIASVLEAITPGVAEARIERFLSGAHTRPYRREGPALSRFQWARPPSHDRRPDEICGSE